MNEQKKLPVVIIGGGISGLALAAKLDQLKCPFVLLEKEPRFGGQIHTKRKNGFIYEIGPNTGSLSNQELLELLEYAHVEPLIADEAAKARWILKNQKIRSLPASFLAGIYTPLFTVKDKLRILGEPWRKIGTNPQETVGELAERRLGKSFVKYAVDPFISGIYAGDPYRLVTKYAMPKLYNLEQEHGSFIRGAMAKARQRKQGFQTGPKGDVFSVPGGFGKLVDALVEKLQERGTLYLGAENTQVLREIDHWLVKTEIDGVKQEIRAAKVVSTVPASQLPSLFSGSLQEKIAPLAELEYAPVVEVSIGFRQLPNTVRNAFGLLIPSSENRSILGILFPSVCFKERVENENGALFTVFMGGTRRPQLVGFDKSELADIALKELRKLLQIPDSAEPDLIEVNAYPEAIPQYTSSYAGLLSQLQRIEQDYPGLYLAGGLRDGIGLANRVAQGWKLGEEISK